MPSHLITDDVTKVIAERFLAMHPFLGDVAWDRYIPNESDSEDSLWDSLADAAEGEGTTWRVKFTDPTGVKLHLYHRLILRGVRASTYSDVFVPAVADWMMLPAEKRTAEALPATGVSALCQRTLFKGLEPYGRAEARFLDDLAS